MRILKCLLIGYLFLTLSACNGQDEIKINGVSFVAAGGATDSSEVQPIVNANANYAAIMPFAYIKSLDHSEIMFNSDRQWFGERVEGVKQYIEELRKYQIKVMIKPQIWVGRGDFTGNIKMTSEANWKALEESYSNFILTFVELAEEINAEMLCIGTELELFIKHRPEYWTDLIRKIRTQYKGKLTYAANWDEFKRTPFWDQLDYIGVDAYFPVSDEKTPTVETCIEGWKVHKPIIKGLSEQYQKPILFTEYGYRSVDYSAREPWVYDRSMNQVNLQAQVNATRALYETFWNEEWFAGGFIWKWFTFHERAGGKEDNQFTPQNKPVEEIIKAYYKIED
ncbi:glycoside hydrolase [Ichthyenterobacterium sp. W332]|uniref:Glycoside hydrolase n=1 Tax=Microcosmobacter mediterraneus TaxID=3075607 RepID=A0ABU2YK20_9FLAO|nr:glycoside hydrolase [Ichthyenterobacterium sp. W332]MDT0558515.1 glycoside hydrolase [Ichthyenterobacterium sp. W332]